MQLHAFTSGDAIEVSYHHGSVLGGSALRARYAVAVLLLASTVVASSSSFEAERKNDLQIGLTAQRVVADGPQEKLIDHPAMEAGHIVQYTAAYYNRSERTLADFQPVLPIPHGTEFIAQSAQPAPAEASIDGKTFEPYPIRRTRKLNNGLDIVVDVPANAYRALRWSPKNLGPAATFTTSARVRVLVNND